MKYILWFYCLFASLIPVPISAQIRNDIVITEILPDPNPVVGLPASSFIELKNNSKIDYSLRNWKIGSLSAMTTIKADQILKSDSFIILCPGTYLDEYRQFGNAIALTSFPSLNNDSGTILLQSDKGILIYALHYDKSWYRNIIKSEGGWSLEMIDVSKSCIGEINWTASNDPQGGTPGRPNSVNAILEDIPSPLLQRGYAIDSQNFILIFDQSLDSLNATQKDNYSISPPVEIDSVFPEPPFNDYVYIHLNDSLQRGKVYHVEVQNLKGCAGVETGAGNTCRIAIPEKIKPGDIIFNEILFNPPPLGYDYLELYNRSDRSFNCSELFLAGKNADGSVKEPIAIEKQNRTIFPGDYLLLTVDSQWVKKSYPLSQFSQFIQMKTLPSLPDDQGSVLLITDDEMKIDELDYNHHWHSPLLNNESGVSLERIRPDLPTDEYSNWCSAAASIGYGTPGFKNSESNDDSAASRMIEVEPKIFSPDFDGYKDFCFVNYQLPGTGYYGSISIYNIKGQLVRKLVDNISWAVTGSFRWDGLNDQQQLLPTGQYIIYSELFSPNGTVKNNKSVCVLARRR